MIVNDALGIQLPRKELQEGHSYGNVMIAAKYCGLKNPVLSLNGEWQHGAIIPERNIHPEFVIGSDGKSYKRRNTSVFYVARQDQKDYLEENGYKTVHAIGMPIIYLKRPEIVRVKNSLLIMPIHSLPETLDNFDSFLYANYLDQVRSHFNEVAVCIHSSCLSKGHWTQPFVERGIQIIEGANEKDINSLERMAHLFSRFEYVTTNGFGSHVVYAAFFGAKVSISGPAEKFDRHALKDVTFYKNASAILDILEQWEKEDIIKKAYPFLYLEPHHAIQHISWASDQLGLENKKQPHELRELFEWTRRNILIYRIKNLLPEKSRERLKYIIIRLNNLYIGIIGKILHKNESMIFSHLTMEEKLLLYKVAKSLPDNSVNVEIGSYLGSSTCFIAKGLKGNGKVICIDTWENQNMKYVDSDIDAEERDTYSEFAVNTHRYRKKIIEIRKWSYDAIEDVKKIRNEIDFLFIDGDHHYEGVKKDWDLYSQFLKKGSLVGFHDTGWADGVKKVINEDVLSVAMKIETLPNMEIFRIE